MAKRARRFYTNPRPSPKASMSDGAKIALALAGVAVVGGIGYYLYQQSQTTAAAGGGSTVGGNANASTILGSGGSNVALPAASTTSDGLPISYEAGPGAAAPLVPTAGA
jgi:hypothetical protein